MNKRDVGQFTTKNPTVAAIMIDANQATSELEASSATATTPAEADITTVAASPFMPSTKFRAWQIPAEKITVTKTATSGIDNKKSK
jgi:hypothetical protein